MAKQKQLNSVHLFENASGRIEYNLTNDYMFKAVFQESKEALTGLVSALLHVLPEEVSVEVSNPIALGKSISSKDFYLDLRVVVSDKIHLNLEMQITDYKDWPERSLSYSMRVFDNLKKGQYYSDLKELHHISFVTFDMFKDNNLLYDTYMVSSIKNSQVYTDKFKISVVNLRQLDSATEEDKIYRLDKWCKLIVASTWEELKELAKGDSYMQAAIEKEFDLLSDFEVREEARRRREYYEHVANLNATITEKETVIKKRLEEIEEKESIILKKQTELKEKDSIIEQKQTELKEKDSVIEQKDADIRRLQETIEKLKGELNSRSKM